MTTKIILDVDTGSDDAVAIMVAALSPELEVLGICTVNGNRGLEFTTENTLRVLDHIGATIPVYKGCPLPLVSTLTPGRRPPMPLQGPKDSKEDVHGDYLPLPPATSIIQKKHAVSWLIETLLESDGDITLVPVGPLTNIAMALRAEPSIAAKIKELVIMGGGHRVNNITSGAEFNFWVDPEAAKIVFASGVNIRLVPLDATHSACISREECRKLRELGTPAASAAADMIEKRIAGYNLWQPMSIPDTVPVHDALAVCAILDPSVLQSIIHVYVDIDCSGGIADGMSICDEGQRIKDAAKNAYVALDADRDKFFEMIYQILSRTL